MKLLTITLLLTRFVGVQGTSAGAEVHHHHDHDHDHVDSSMDLPNVFLAHRGRTVPCHENGVVASWCDVHLDRPNMECVILPEFDAYGCSCIGNPSVCPDDCVGGTKPVEKTKSSISCRGLPTDEPNYILREFHPLNRCENNAVVASWCDEYVNPHLECGLAVVEDEYFCKCSGRVSNCPSDCVGGVEPVEKTHSIVRCKGIPVDQPNYILVEQ